MNEGNNSDLVQEMQWVRKLLMLQVLASGYQQKDIALLLGVSDATLSRMLPKGISKKSKI
jgi:predicted transcriptional regulator